MDSREGRGLLQPGERAPAFELPAADREGTVSLSACLARGGLFLALFRGLYCPFCRRQMVRLGTTAVRLRTVGVETLAVVATRAERARLYFRFRPSPYPVGADPDLSTHRAYGLPQSPMTPRVAELVEAAASDLARELGIAVEAGDAGRAIKTFDGFEPVESDERDAERDQALAVGQFLIDRAGIVRWANLELKPGELPSAEEVLARAAAL
jgi:peroxiredoxin